MPPLFSVHRSGRRRRLEDMFVERPLATYVVLIHLSVSLDYQLRARQCLGVKTCHKVGSGD